MRWKSRALLYVLQPKWPCCDFRSLPWFKKLESDEVTDDSSASSCKTHQLSSSNLFIKPRINGTHHYFQIDCGSQVSTIPIHLLSIEQKHSIRPSHVVLSAFGGSRVQHHGHVTIDLEIESGEFIRNLDFLVTKSDSAPLIGNNSLLS